MDQEVENLEDHGCCKNRDLDDPGADGEVWICSSYPTRHTTTIDSTE